MFISSYIKLQDCITNSCGENLTKGSSFLTLRAASVTHFETNCPLDINSIFCCCCFVKQFSKKPDYRFKIYPWHITLLILLYLYFLKFRDYYAPCQIKSSIRMFLQHYFSNTYLENHTNFDDIYFFYFNTIVCIYIQGLIKIQQHCTVLIKINFRTISVWSLVYCKSLSFLEDAATQ